MHVGRLDIGATLDGADDRLKVALFDGFVELAVHGDYGLQWRSG
jgi:hypothetical protein